MKKVILIAHGSYSTFPAISKVKTITKSGKGLSFKEAGEYIKSTKTYPEYTSSGFGYNFSGIGLAEFRKIIDKPDAKSPPGTGIVFSGFRRGGDINGTPIHILKHPAILSRAALNTYIYDNKIDSLILLSCRKSGEEIILLTHAGEYTRDYSLPEIKSVQGPNDSKILTPWLIRANLQENPNNTSKTYPGVFTNNFIGLTDDEHLEIFGIPPLPDTGIIDTGRRQGLGLYGATRNPGKKIYVYRDPKKRLTKNDIKLFMAQNNISSILLLVCGYTYTSSTTSSFVSTDKPVISKIILLANAYTLPEAPSIPRVKSLTAPNKYLSSKQANEYVKSTGSWAEYPSNGIVFLSGIDRKEFQDTFKTTKDLPPGNGILFSGFRKGGDINGTPIYIIKGSPKEVSHMFLSKYMQANNILSATLIIYRFVFPQDPIEAIILTKPFVKSRRKVDSDKQSYSSQIKVPTANGIVSFNEAETLLLQEIARKVGVLSPKENEYNIPPNYFNNFMPLTLPELYSIMPNSKNIDFSYTGEVVGGFKKVNIRTGHDSEDTPVYVLEHDYTFMSNPEYFDMSLDSVASLFLSSHYKYKKILLLSCLSPINNNEIILIVNSSSKQLLSHSDSRYYIHHTPELMITSPYHKRKGLNITEAHEYITKTNSLNGYPIPDPDKEDYIPSFQPIKHEQYSHLFPVITQNIEKFLTYDSIVENAIEFSGYNAAGNPNGLPVYVLTGGDPNSDISIEKICLFISEHKITRLLLVPIIV